MKLLQVTNVTSVDCKIEIKPGCNILHGRIYILYNSNGIPKKHVECDCPTEEQLPANVLGLLNGASSGDRLLVYYFDGSLSQTKDSFPISGQTYFQLTFKKEIENWLPLPTDEVSQTLAVRNGKVLKLA